MLGAIDIANLSLSFITAVCAIYLAFAALKHSARPDAKVNLNTSTPFCSGKTELLVFSFKNVGHWYSKPTIVNMTVFINFDHNFQPLCIEYGSVQETKDENVRIGSGKMKFLKAKGLKLSYGEEDEEIHVKVKCPDEAGVYKIKISAYSDNGLSLLKEFKVKVTKPLTKDPQSSS